MKHFLRGTQNLAHFVRLNPKIVSFWSIGPENFMGEQPLIS
jgi:hypothetical protein